MTVSRSVCTGILFAFIVGSLILVGCHKEPAREVKVIPDAFEQNNRLGGGANIGSILYRWDEWDEEREKEELDMLLGLGMKNVRINLRPFLHASKDPPYTLSSKFFDRLDWLVNESLLRGFTVIIDHHQYRVMGQDPMRLKDKYMATWKQIAEHYRDYPENVYFELLNEPNNNLTPYLWNYFLKEVYDIIRASNPTRTLVIGPGNWNKMGELESLILPEDDRNIIVAIHFYNPHKFTHQGKSGNVSGIPWPGNPEEIQALIDEFSWFVSVLHYRGFEKEYFDKTIDAWIMAIHGTIEPSLSRELVFPFRILQRNLSEFLKRSEITSEPENQAQREFANLLLEKKRRDATDYMMDLLKKGNRPNEVCSGVLMPALKQIGIMWQKNKISAADEHAATEICRYIIFRLCDSIPREKPLPYQALVSCVPGEEHEMGAEIMASYLESKGWRVYFVGHSAPEQDNIHAITKHKPDVVFLSVTLISNLPETVEFLKKIREIPLKTKIVLGGKAAIAAKETVQKFTDAVIDDYQEVHSKALELLGKNA